MKPKISKRAEAWNETKYISGIWPEIINGNIVIKGKAVIDGKEANIEAILSETHSLALINLLSATLIQHKDFIKS